MENERIFQSVTELHQTVAYWGNRIEVLLNDLSSEVKKSTSTRSEKVRRLSRMYNVGRTLVEDSPDDSVGEVASPRARAKLLELHADASALMRRVERLAELDWATPADPEVYTTQLDENMES